MFVARTIAHPAIGQLYKLEEHLKGLLQPGQRASVARSVTGPTCFTVTRWFEQLSDFEQWRSHAITPQRAEQLAPLIGEAIVTQLWETTVDAPAGAAPGFISRFTFEAATGKAAELRRVVEARAQRLNAGKTRRAVQILVSGGPASVAMIVLHADLAELEAVRAEALASPDTAFLQQLSSCLAGPARTPELFQVLATSQ